jgi:beta-glucosidase
MSSFNDINGQPVTSSKKYLTDILRDMLGFEGYVVSDWGSVYQLLIQGVADDKAHCAELAIDAGVDMDMCTGYYSDSLAKLVKEGRVTEETVNTAVRRVLRVKLAKGLFERPYTRERTVDRAEHLKDSKKLAAESAVLLKNDGVLPLKKNIRVALAGPFLNERRSLLGTWTLDFVLSDVTTFAEAMREKVGDENIIIGKNDGLFDFSLNCTYNADAVILALGESSLVTGEARSLADITITPAQIELIRTMRSSGKKVIGVFFCARPIAMEGIAENFDAILYAWHSGTKAAKAACDILFGDTVPSGKTAITFPRKTGQIPIYYNSVSTSRYVNGYYGEHDLNPYEDCLGSPYYPFGYGLSYAKFIYGKPATDVTMLSLDEIKAGRKFCISIEVKNNGEYDGKETVQLYIRDLTASCMRPLKELKAFEKRMIKAGETERFNFELGYKVLGFYDFDGNYIEEKGKFNIYVGENSLTENSLQVEII